MDRTKLKALAVLLNMPLDELEERVTTLTTDVHTKAKADGVRFKTASTESTVKAAGSSQAAQTLGWFNDVVSGRKRR